MDVSFLIPTNRDHSLVKKTIQSINLLPSRYSYEICVYCDQEVTGDNVRWIREESQNGVAAAFNELCRQAHGDFLYILTDDCAVEPDVFNAVDFLNCGLYANRAYWITTLRTNHHHAIGLAWTHEDGHKIPDYTCLRFPVLRKDVFKLLGGYIFHPRFKYHWVDSWLSYWIGENGEPPMECPDAGIVNHTSSSNTSYDEYDLKLYFDLIRKHRAGYKEYV